MTEENTEFAELFRVSGWNQREAAEKLFTTSATISRYLSNSIAVPRGVVEMFKLVLASENPGVLKPAGPRQLEYRSEASELREQLEELKRVDPRLYQSARTVIDSLHQQAMAKKPPAQEPTLVTKEGKPLMRAPKDQIVAIAARANPLHAEVVLPKTEADEPSARKPAPSPPASKRPNTRPAVPKPAPVSHVS